MSAPEQKPDSIPPLQQSPVERLRGAAGSEEEDEIEMWEGGYSAKAMYGTWMIMGIATIVALITLVTVASLRTNPWAWLGVGGGLVALWIFSLSKLLLRKMNVWYELTTQRFKHRAGVLTRTNNRIELIDIDDVTYRQGPIQAMLGVGTITIRSSDSTDPELTVQGIANVRTVSDMIDDARRKERRKRGLHIEAV